jgi:signal transduction histidine kinase
MILIKALTSYTFRYISLFVAGLSGAVFLVLMSLYFIFSYNHFVDVNESITEEVDTMLVVYSGQGMQGLNQYIDDQTQRGFFNKFFYLVADRDYKKLSGNMERWPKYREFAQDWIKFEFDMQELADGDVDLIARARTLPNGSHIMAARHFEEVYESGSLVLKILIRSMLATLFFGFFGSIITSIVAERRLESLNVGIKTITTGDLSRRLSVGDSSGDMRLLINHINRLLNQIESLMEGVQLVSDAIAHDLRTPLTRMRNRLTLLHEHASGEQRGDIVILIEESDSLLETFGALLRIAQLEAGNRRSQFAPVKLNELVYDVVELYEPLAQEKNISVNISIEEPASVMGDRDLLFQMLANLFDNAVKYTPEDGAINLTLRVAQNRMRHLLISDTGPGIPLADRENVFQRFFRLESSRSEYPGNGLGLSLVQAVIKAHYGSIRLSDNNPGLAAEVHLP